MSQNSQSSKRSGGSLFTLVIVATLLIGILSLGYAGYNLLSPSAITVPRLQFLTKTQTMYSTQTVTSIGPVTNIAMISTANVGYGYSYGNYQSCTYYGCYYPSPGYNYNYPYYNDPCQSAAGSNTAQCSGYLYQDSSGCVELVIPISTGYTSQAYQYYTLHNLPSSYPSLGTWVTVTGQLSQGYNFTPNGAACPGNYINITSIS